MPSGSDPLVGISVNIFDLEFEVLRLSSPSVCFWSTCILMSKILTHMLNINHYHLKYKMKVHVMLGKQSIRNHPISEFLSNIPFNCLHRIFDMIINCILYHLFPYLPPLWPIPFLDWRHVCLFEVINRGVGVWNRNSSTFSCWKCWKLERHPIMVWEAFNRLCMLILLDYVTCTLY